ncbi:MAG: UDP-N-acetylmuramate dehydrogenase, partial [Microgenomates group bacterium LiPW_16]
AKTAESLKVPCFILGGGSNILVSDRGFRGLVIKNKSREIKTLGYKGKIQNQKSKIQNVLVEADAGVPFNQLVRFTIEEGFGGLEEFLGLPGTVGGAIVGNAHWQDKEIRDLLVSKKTFGKILLSAVFRLKKEEKKILWRRAQRAAQYRQKTQPCQPSAGCIFKNIKASEAARIGTPGFTTSAGFLIEAAGLKGTKIGNVQISLVHANFIINLGSGKAADVLKLISLIKEKIEEKFGVDLKEEIVLVGEF